VWKPLFATLRAPSTRTTIRIKFDGRPLIALNTEPFIFSFWNDSKMTQENEIPPDFSAQDYLEWRSPRTGEANPTRMNNPVWEWLIRSRLSAYSANEMFSGPNSIEAGPAWCFDRFGQSETRLPDSRIIMIAGEHEDGYDPDFYIYNDVVVVHPDESITIYAYPREIFPPSDFHSATLISSNTIVLIGNLGYTEQRQAGCTQVLLLDLDDFSVRSITTHGTPPGWIHAHHAKLGEDKKSILISRGMLDSPQHSVLVENIDDWSLDLENWQWTRETRKKWTYCIFSRTGNKNIMDLFMLRSIAFAKKMNWKDDLWLNNFQKLGPMPDLSIIPTLYRPEIPHQEVPQKDDEEHNTFRIEIEGTIIRYVEKTANIQMIVEGELPASSIEALKEDLRKKLSLLDRADWQVENVDMG
jgi:hypothetical protein